MKNTFVRILLATVIFMSALTTLSSGRADGILFDRGRKIVEEGVLPYIAVRNRYQQNLSFFYHREIGLVELSRSADGNLTVTLSDKIELVLINHDAPDASEKIKVRDLRVYYNDVREDSDGNILLGQFGKVLEGKNEIEKIRRHYYFYDRNQSDTNPLDAKGIKAFIDTIFPVTQFDNSSLFIKPLENNALFVK